MPLTFEEAKHIVSECDCHPYTLRFEHLRDHRDVWYIQVSKIRRDVVTGEQGVGSGAKYLVSPHSTPEEVRQKCLAACIVFAEHEVREHFLWRGRQIFGPHMNHQKLWEAATEEVTREQLTGS